jgi:hypothetical protein
MDLDDDKPDDNVDDDVDDDKPDDDDDPAALKSALASARREAAKLRQELGSARTDLEQERDKSRTDRDRELEQARREGADKVRGEVARELLEADVLRVATGRLRDPDDALRYLELDGLGDVDRGKTRDTAIGKALDELLADKTYLAAGDDDDAGRNGDKGARTSGARARTRTSSDDPSAWLRSSVRK